MPRQRRPSAAPDRPSHASVSTSNAKAGLADFFLSPEFLAPYGGSAWVWFPTAPEPRRPPMAKADIYFTTLHADAYSEAARDALRAGDDAAVLDALEVQAGFLAALIGQLRNSPSPSEISVH
jgi:hypothetical protein